MKFSVRSISTKSRPVLKRLAYSPFPPILLAASLVLSEYQKNLTQVYPRALAIPLFAAIGIGLISFYAFRIVMRDRLAVTVASLLAVPLLYDYESRFSAISPIIKALSPVSNGTLIKIFCVALLLAFCGFLGWTASFITKRFKLVHETVAQAIILAVVVSFLFGAASVGVKLAGLLPQMKPVNSPKIPSPTQVASAKPDIYYIVLEDYAGNNTLKSLYNFDNSPFLRDLGNRGFMVPEVMYSNFPYTTDSIPSTLEMDYLVGASKRFKNSPPSAFPMRSIVNNPPVVSELKKQGYQYLHVGSWWENTRKIPAADINYTEPFKLHVGGLHTTLDGFGMLILSKSVIGQVLRPGLTIGDYKLAYLAVDDPVMIVKYQFDTVKTLASSSAQGGRFIFLHVMVPHTPFIYNADGSKPVYDSRLNNFGATVEKKYINQLSYINDQTKDLIDHIKKSAKTPPVIILQSDEGPHPNEMSEGSEESGEFDLMSLAPVKLKQKYEILAAYYLPGATSEEVAGINSPVNAFRVVLNHYFGYTLPLLPDCSFASKPKKPLDYIDVTAQLRGSADTRCPEIHK